MSRQTAPKSKFHRIRSVCEIKPFCLRVEFEGGIEKEYDLSLWKEHPAFALLFQKPGFVKSVKVEPGGYGVSWNDDMDLSYEEIWGNGRRLLLPRLINWTEGLTVAVVLPFPLVHACFSEIYNFSPDACIVILWLLWPLAPTFCISHFIKHTLSRFFLFLPTLLYFAGLVFLFYGILFTDYEKVSPSGRALLFVPMGVTVFVLFPLWLLTIATEIIQRYRKHVHCS